MSGQEEAERFLRGLADSVRETHVSLIALRGGDAFKMKKAVDLGFLDFTRLDERERLLRREMTLNAPHAPGMYRGVEPITRGADGALRLGGDGAPVEWVLRMARLPPESFLDCAPMPDAAALADAVWALHKAAPPLPGDGALDGVIAQNRQAALEAGLPPGRVEAWHAAAQALHGRLSPFLAQRAAEGRVRRCHGDLHLGNLCLIEGRPCPFDALEFDEALATIDVGYDLAFLLMDLEMRHGRAAANAVLNRYVARGDDAGLVAALPLWLSLRAMIRAHVERRRGGDWAALLDFAEAALRPAPGRLVAVGGLPGTGKSTLARRLAPLLGPAPGALVLRSDEIRKRMHGVLPEEKLPARAYTAEASAAVFAEMRRMARAALAGGHAVVADAVFLRAEERDAIAACGVSFTGFWLDAPLDVLRARVEARRGDASDATVAVLEDAASRDPGPMRWTVLPAEADPLPAAFMTLDLPSGGPA
ncbi:bifunctional aminoglycoside phosphotransferase/ATP-binding protein [Sabulicella rubraurantiaca]|uniref:bifunctional aminoglycoside phosphotransferase/ATP-binding protein n=1 Tax=Sabulicella rubraurantiaca TaxID=2811429 RepID=UPI002E2C0598|nr:AAA family ATPase [Sabulicella rubraurantiaca]